MHDDNVFVIVPARGGSKRLPRKNVRILGGLPLIAHTARFLKDEGCLEAAVLSTDDAEIAQVGRDCGLNVPFMRPPEISTDTATTIDVVLHALDWYENQYNRGPAFVAVLQPTSPFRREGMLRDAVAILMKAPSVAAVVAMSKLHVTANYLYTGTDDLRRVSNAPETAYEPCGSIYLARTSAFRSQRSLYCTPLRALLVGACEAIDIDSEEDLNFAQALVDSGVIPQGGAGRVHPPTGATG